MEIYDLIVVGGGPAGLTAAIYGGRARLKTLLIEKGQIGGQAYSTRELVNYPGFFNETSGPDVINSMYEHARHFGVSFLKEDVSEVSLDEGLKKVISVKGNIYYGKTIILCPGSEPRLLNIEGEKELRGQGVSYCATCDAEFYEGLTVVVVGNGDAAIEEAMYLTKFAEKVVIIVIHDEGILDCNQYSAVKAMQNKRIEFMWNSVLERINGQDEVEGVDIKNLRTGEISTLKADGVFIYIGMKPRTDFIKDLVELESNGYIITNKKMETSIEGVFAAGDARLKYLRQVVTAASDGAVAAVAAERFLLEQEKLKEEIYNNPNPVIVAFWNPTNEKSIKAVSQIEKIISENKFNVSLIKIDTSRSDLLAKRFSVYKIPHFLLVKSGKIVKDLIADDANGIVNQIKSIVL